MHVVRHVIGFQLVPWTINRRRRHSVSIDGETMSGDHDRRRSGAQKRGQTANELAWLVLTGRPRDISSGDRKENCHLVVTKMPAATVLPILIHFPSYCPGLERFTNRSFTVLFCGCFRLSRQLHSAFMSLHVSYFPGDFSHTLFAKFLSLADILQILLRITWSYFVKNC